MKLTLLQGEICYKCAQYNRVFFLTVHEIVKYNIRTFYIRYPSFRPPADPMKPLKALVYDSWFDKFKGIICNIAVKDGVLLKGENNLHSHQFGDLYLGDSLFFKQFMIYALL